MPKRFSNQFRDRAVSLVREGRDVEEVAASLGVSTSSVYRWRLQDEVDRGLRPGTSSGDTTRLTAALKRIKVLEEELAATKMAATMLADEGVSPKDGSRSLRP